ncbi:SDR family oxidoreductase [Verticiella sediminum]|uniref:SDR family oxidoreductase n=1 Tax=Verticiella sediminum TaxID=1247510 RepID=A0A556ALZ3_9BURK|nr:SDR family oxidoreductase [Verticiella sediminum]TSH93902.1 SDR family oxidoreductase [Verticiella sediminum]
MSIQEMFSLAGRTAIITGGSRGLGLQIAEVLGDAGARLVLSARKADELEHAVEHLAKRGIEAHWVAGNMGDESDARALAAAAREKLGEIDVLVNNAGASWGAAAEDHPLDAWDKLMNLNVRGLFVLSQEVGRSSMIPRRKGSIINVASIAGLRGNHPDEMKTLAYNTSKGAVVNLTRALAGEWGRYGIRVNALAPGFFPSKMTRGLLSEVGDKLVARVPLARLGDEEDLKGAALLFASDAGKHITGQILAVDGGVSAIL